MELASELLAFLFFAAIIAGCIDALAGGGGLITIPAMLMCGLPPVSAIATNMPSSAEHIATTSNTNTGRTF